MPQRQTAEERERMREEESERWQEEVGRAREELEGKHGAKMAALRQTELETMERLHRKERVGDERERGSVTVSQAAAAMLEQHCSIKVSD